MTNYTEVTKQYLARETEMLRSKRTWQGIAFGLLAINAVLAIAWIGKEDDTKIIPWIVQVDALGKAVASGPADSVSLENDAVVRAFLFRFVEQAKSIITDEQAMKQNFRAVYRMTVPSVAKNYLDPWYKDTAPIQQAATISRSVRPLGFLKQSDNTYLVEWEEEDRDKSRRVVAKSRWKAIVTIAMEPRKTQEQMEADVFNPFGIYIVNIDWSKEL